MDIRRKYFSERFKEDITLAVNVLKDGGIILYPTDTIWGIGCDATCPSAVKRIFDLKQRDDSKALLVLVSDKEQLHSIIPEIPANINDILNSDFPLTIIYPQARNIAFNLKAQDGSVGVRICKEPFVMEICRRLGKPIVSTSANISGCPSPSVFEEICEEIKDGVDFIPQYRRNDKCKSSPSKIIRIGIDGELSVIR